MAIGFGTEWAARLKPNAITAYLQASTRIMNHRLGDRCGPRRFDRVIVVAQLGKRNGLSVGARLLSAFLERSGVDAELVDATEAVRNPFFKARHRAGSVYVFHCGAPQTASLIGSVMPAAMNAWRIGFWNWELPDTPSDWEGCDRNINEIWTASTFSATSLRKLTSRPVRVVPYRLERRPARPGRSQGPFTVLAMADSKSSFARKNPEGACRAFRIAFGDSPDARLILKLGGCPNEVAALEHSLRQAGLGGNVSVLKDYLDESELDALYDETDVLLSLHRAEGFGLPMLEAMARGIAVIGTGWSGNLDFMGGGNGCLVPFRLVPVVDPAGIYDGGFWAEPDVEAAAGMLRILAEDPGRSARRASGIDHAVDGAWLGAFPPELAAA